MTTKYQAAYEIINRSEINNAPYNPRRISDKALSQLKKNIKERGLMGGIVVNKRTMNLVSGHQRLKALDALEKSKDYSIRVEMVSLTDKEEKEQNIFMNSSNVQGEFDNDILKGLLPEIDFEAAGLSEYDLNIIGVDYLQESEEESEAISDIKSLGKPLEERKAAVKEAKQAYKEKLQNEWEGDPYFTVTFDNYKAKVAFLDRLGLDADERFIKGELLAAKVDIKSKF